MGGCQPGAQVPLLPLLASEMPEVRERESLEVRNRLFTRFVWGDYG